MRFVADECCDFAAVRALRSGGYDVLAITENQQSSVDREILQFAMAQDPVLLTEDKDFGWLVFAARLDSSGVVLIRYPSLLRATLGADILRLAQDHAGKLAGNFVVLRPGNIRITPKMP